MTLQESLILRRIKVGSSSVLESFTEGVAISKGTFLAACTDEIDAINDISTRGTDLSEALAFHAVDVTYAYAVPAGFESRR